jgi:hypothetical protein
MADTITPTRKQPGDEQRTVGLPKSPEEKQLPKLAFSIPEFCETHGISEGFYFQLQKEGKGPETMHVGARRLISAEAAARWRKKNTVALKRGGP